MSFKNIIICQVPLRNSGGQRVASPGDTVPAAGAGGPPRSPTRASFPALLWDGSYRRVSSHPSGI